jgi:hypothetical protein
MFHPKRAPRDQGADNPISGDPSAQSAVGAPAEQLTTNPWPRRQATAHRQTAGHGIDGWAGRLLVALAAITVLGAILAASASATAQAEGSRQAGLPPSPTAGTPVPNEQTTSATRVELHPNPAVIEPGGKVTYTVHGLDADGSHLTELGNLADKTRFSITPDGSCTPEAVCTADAPRDYTVTATVDLNGLTVTGEAILHVVRAGRLAGLELDPNPNPAEIEPGGKVTYTVHGLDADERHLPELGDLDLAEQTGFSIKPEDGSCIEAVCTATKLGVP